MKNLNKRTKILLGIAGLVIVVVVAGFLVLVPGEGTLFGGSIIHISPQNPTINVGQNLDMSINSIGSCSWSSSNEGVVVVTYPNPVGYARDATVQGAGPGQAKIKADCVTNHYTTVTVRTPPQVTFNPPPVNGLVTVHVGQSVTASVGTTGTDCTWGIAPSRNSWYSQHAVSFNPTTGTTTAMTGVYAGYSTIIQAVCFNGKSTGNAQVKVVQ